MRKYFLIFFMFSSVSSASAQHLFVADTFIYTINLDLSKNNYLKTVPLDLLNGYCHGNWKAYYPKRTLNECLLDDFLQHFNVFQINTATFSCLEDYCANPYFKDFFQQFTRKLKYSEIVFFDQQHSFVKREIISLQVFYSRNEYNGWKHYEGPIFWMQELKKNPELIKVYNKNVRPDAWTLEKEFNHAGFITNENKQNDDKQKLQKILQIEEY